jgi:hypothetical protein
MDLFDNSRVKDFVEKWPLEVELADHDIELFNFFGSHGV